jgi:hypothetical protein
MPFFEIIEVVLHLRNTGSAEERLYEICLHVGHL